MSEVAAYLELLYAPANRLAGHSHSRAPLGLGILLNLPSVLFKLANTKNCCWQVSSVFLWLKILQLALKCTVWPGGIKELGNDYVPYREYIIVYNEEESLDKRARTNIHKKVLALIGNCL